GGYVAPGADHAAVVEADARNAVGRRIAVAHQQYLRADQRRALVVGHHHVARLSGDGDAIGVLATRAADQQAAGAGRVGVGGGELEVAVGPLRPAAGDLDALRGDVDLRRRAVLRRAGLERRAEAEARGRGKRQPPGVDRQARRGDVVLLGEIGE